MRFQTRVAMESYPGLHLHGKLDPVDLHASVSGSCASSIGSIRLHIDQVPIRLAIPFLKRRRPPLLGTIGGLDLRLSPIEFSMEHVSLNLDGTLGTKGLSGGLDGHIDCTTKMQLDGDVKGRVGTFRVELEDERPEHHEEEEHHEHHEGPEHHKEEKHHQHHEGPEHHERPDYPKDPERHRED